MGSIPTVSIAGQESRSLEPAAPHYADGPVLNPSEDVDHIAEFADSSVRVPSSLGVRLVN